MATSQKQINANQQNATKSTGPTTTGGRQTSSKNAVTHGLYALPLPGEDESEVERRREDLTRELGAEGILGQFKVEEILRAMLKLERAHSAEQRLVQQQIDRARTAWEKRGRERCREMSEIIRAASSEDHAGPVDGERAVVVRELASTADGLGVIRDALAAIAGVITATGHLSPADLRVLTTLCGEDDSPLGMWVRAASPQSDGGDAAYLKRVRALLTAEGRVLEARQEEVAAREDRELESELARSAFLDDARSGPWERAEAALHKRIREYEKSI